MMNKEVVKAMNKKENKFDTVRKWWRKNGYKVMRVILFPIYGVCVLKEKIATKLNNKEIWSEEKANEILNYYIPRRAEWDTEDKTFYFFDNGYGWGYNSAKKYLNRKDRRFWRVNCTWGGKMRSYLINDFELEGFKKEVGDCADGWTEVCFRLIEK